MFRLHFLETRVSPNERSFFYLFEVEYLVTCADSIVQRISAQAVLYQMHERHGISYTWFRKRAMTSPALLLHQHGDCWPSQRRCAMSLRRSYESSCIRCFFTDIRVTHHHHMLGWKHRSQKCALRCLAWKSPVEPKSMATPVLSGNKVVCQQQQQGSVLKLNGWKSEITNQRST